MSYGIIRRHGGSIAIESQLNEGTTFTIFLRYRKRLLSALSSRSGKNTVRPLRVLVVDDHTPPSGNRERVSGRGSPYRGDGG